MFKGMARAGRGCDIGPHLVYGVVALVVASVVAVQQQLHHLLRRGPV